MKKVLKMIALSMVLFVGGAFVLPAQMGTIKSHAAAKMQISKKTATITKGKTLKLRIKNAKGKKIRWFSSKKKVATVKKGKVTAKKAGKTTITAKVGKKKIRCKVTVKKRNVNYVYISRTGEKYHLSAKCSNMQSPKRISLRNAKKRGYTRCKKCYKKKIADLTINYSKAKNEVFFLTVSVKDSVKNQIIINRQMRGRSDGSENIKIKYVEKAIVTIKFDNKIVMKKRLR